MGVQSGMLQWIPEVCFDNVCTGLFEFGGGGGRRGVHQTQGTLQGVRTWWLMIV